jgi:hypothetical protein
MNYPLDTSEQGFSASFSQEVTFASLTLGLTCGAVI